jgi:hypothetical protein
MRELPYFVYLCHDDLLISDSRASTPKRGARRSLFPSPSKDRSQLDKDSALAADGVLAPGEETVISLSSFAFHCWPVHCLLSTPTN